MKKQPKTYSDNICYICRKIIKDKPYYAIGKNLKGLELYRHKKCNPSNLSKVERDKIKLWIDNSEIIKKRKKRKKK